MRFTIEELELLKFLVKKYIFFMPEDGDNLIRKIEDMEDELRSEQS